MNFDYFLVTSCSKFEEFCWVCCRSLKYATFRPGISSSFYPELSRYSPTQQTKSWTLHTSWLSWQSSNALPYWVMVSCNHRAIEWVGGIPISN